jgi:hypothetical protein
MTPIVCKRRFDLFPGQSIGGSNPIDIAINDSGITNKRPDRYTGVYQSRIVGPRALRIKLDTSRDGLLS